MNHKASTVRWITLMPIFCLIGCNGDSSARPSAAERAVVSPKMESVQITRPTPIYEQTVQDIVLSPKTPITGKVSLLIPATFAIMDEEALRIKYPTEHRPTLVYSDESGAINLAIHHTQDKMPQRHLATFHKLIDAAYRNSHPSAVWISSGIIDIDGRAWFNLVLRTPAMDTEILNTVVGTSLDDRLLLVSFNVTKELEKEWLQPSEVVIKSLRIAN